MMLLCRNQLNARAQPNARAGLQVLAELEVLVQPNARAELQAAELNARAGLQARVQLKARAEVPPKGDLMALVQEAPPASQERARGEPLVQLQEVSAPRLRAAPGATLQTAREEWDSARRWGRHRVRQRPNWKAKVRAGTPTIPSA